MNLNLILDRISVPLRALIAMLIVMRSFVLVATIVATLMHAVLVISTVVVVVALVVLLVLTAGILLHLVQLLVEVDQMVDLVHQLQR